MTIGESIRHHRKRLNLTQAQLAQRLNVTTQAVSRWENDAGLPDITIAVPLARALGTTTDELLRFGERRAEFEQLWHSTLRKHGDDPEYLLPVSLAALKEFPHDKSFLFRAAINHERLAESAQTEAESMDHIAQALVYARLRWEMDPENRDAERYYISLQEKVIPTPQGFYVLKKRQYR